MKTKLIQDNTPYGVVFFILALLFGVFVFKDFKVDYLHILGLIALAVILIVSIFLIWQNKTIFIDSKSLTLETSMFGIKWIKKYELDKIIGLKCDHNVKSNSYTSTGEVKVLGVDVTPESMKNYYYHPEIISFLYNGTMVKIGKWKKAFGGDEIVEKINQIKNKT